MLCACPSPACTRIGYCQNLGYFTLPIEGTLRARWLRALGWHDSKPGPTEKICIAFWHFLPEHREKNTNGKWKLKELDSPFVDPENPHQVWLSPPPINSPMAFIKEFTDAPTHPSKRWATVPEPAPIWFKQCALLGVQVIRPMKKRSHQQQQSAEDTGLTQKVGNTRIVIEQNNGQMKMSTRYFNSDIPVLQLDLVSIIFRVAFLFQNFRVGFIIGNQKGTGAGRPPRAAVRWLGDSDDGLIDVRALPHLWATKSMLSKHKALTNSFPGLSATQVSELLLGPYQSNCRLF
jgi:hypothetical protein